MGKIATGIGPYYFPLLFDPFCLVLQMVAPLSTGPVVAAQRCRAADASLHGAICALHPDRLHPFQRSRGPDGSAPEQDAG